MSLEMWARELSLDSMSIPSRLGGQKKIDPKSHEAASASDQRRQQQKKCLCKSPRPTSEVHVAETHKMRRSSHSNGRKKNTKIIIVIKIQRGGGCKSPFRASETQSRDREARALICKQTRWIWRRASSASVRHRPARGNGGGLCGSSSQDLVVTGGLAASLRHPAPSARDSQW